MPLLSIATNRTHALQARHDALVSSLIAGYHLAFAIGAASVAIGILAALAVLRPRRAPKLEPYRMQRRLASPHPKGT